MIFLPTLENIQNVLSALRKGEVIGLPTETVYGLAADATQDHAVAHIFEKKQRPSFNPLIIHGYSQDAFQGQVIWNDKADMLAQTFWPGPLTLVLQRSPSSSLSLLASAGLPSLAIRVPNHPVALNILHLFDGLLAAPSANLSGKVSPTQASHVEEDFPDLLIIEGGSTSIGLESTIVDLTGLSPLLLRPGGISREDIESIIGPLKTPSFSPIKAPGMMKSHYAPSLPLRLNVEAPLQGEAYLAFGPTPYEGPHILNLSQTKDLAEAAANFFKMLRFLDHPPFHGIAVAPIPLTRLGLALNDRLQRAAAPRAL
ncbi:MAG: threonylcarbamoyl-AMP synthase [Proteobacteria bacterium]|nr:threonylcarbamoyl-AMP synthase [Pseudomonadota bacterium]